MNEPEYFCYECGEKLPSSAFIPELGFLGILCEDCTQEYEAQRAQDEEDGGQLGLGA